MSTCTETAFDAMAAAHLPGHTLPQIAYTDPDIFAADLEDVFAANWLFVAASAEIPAGDHLAWSVGPDSVLLARDRDRVLHAHHNVCRHRGCRIRPDGSGSSRNLVCGYHSWAYGPDGSLRGAPHMGPDFRNRDTSALGLLPVHVREAAGLVFVCFAEQPPPFDAAATAIATQLEPHRPEHTKVLARYHYRVSANWKALIENNRECYHCSANHPEFCLSNYEIGMTGDTRTNVRYEHALGAQRSRWAARGLPTEDVSFPGGEFFRVARLPLKDGYVTESLSGRMVAPLLGTLTAPDVGSVRIVTLPNSWSHVNADYVMTSRLTPIDVDTTEVDLVFLVHRDATVGIDVDVDEVTAVWQATSEQDWALCEANAAGIRSRAYRPGPLSPVTENSVAVFHDWYFRQLGARPAAQKEPT
jgi:Rieske 2Fe-2S family protein